MATAMNPGGQASTQTGFFTVSGTTAGSDIACTTTKGNHAFRAREIILWETGTLVLNYKTLGETFTDSIPVSVAGVRLPIAQGVVSIDSTTTSGLDYTLIY